ncbi:MAG: UDP-glucose/GDP-mannose dehydrogenase family protein [Myxococcales bacterium]|nr:UDP-glucose/GDP-mannose dehydrogenase family protein [Myxococcales bacterium]
MKVSVIGTGYVGLVAAAGFADHGNDVLCADINEDKIEALRRGEIPIYEPGLDALVERNVAAGRLRFTTSNAEAARHGRVIVLAVGTPTRDHGGGADLSYMFAAATEVAEHLDHPVIVVNKSTVPVGTAERVARLMGEHTSQPVTVASNPEFLKEGSAVNDFMKPDRVIIGTADEQARKVLELLYQPFCRTNDRMLFMDARSAELTKYACNAYLAARISFMNDMANLSDAVGADVERVRRGMGSDPRIGNKFLYPGVGYGGSCFPKDTRALLNTAREYGLTLEIVASAERINEVQKLVLVRKVRAHFSGDLVGKQFALWGLSFKPNTDDIREAPALRIASALLAEGARLRLHDPIAGANFMEALGDKSGDAALFDDPYEAARDADALLLVTEWRQFRSPDFDRLKQLLRTPALFDGRNQWDRGHVESLGFTYHGIGR